MQGIKLNMMRKNKNARHKINMVQENIILLHNSLLIICIIQNGDE